MIPPIELLLLFLSLLLKYVDISSILTFSQGLDICLLELLDTCNSGQGLREDYKSLPRLKAVNIMFFLEYTYL